LLENETMSAQSEDAVSTDQAKRAQRRAGLEARSKVAVGLLAVITVILCAAALKVSAGVTMPLAFAFFVAVLVHPIQTRLSEHLPDRLQ
jgi:predicted PurR-regulated permease PerM